MITVILDPSLRQPLYEQLYRHLRTAIESGAVAGGERLPSKRRLAAHLRLSVKTVENAYAQLAVEGYIRAEVKKGYYARQLAPAPGRQETKVPEAKKTEPAADASCRIPYRYTLKTGRTLGSDFPFSVWARLMRETLRDRHGSLLEPLHPQGDSGLRQEIARYLREFRSMHVHPQQIVLGAGTEYLLGLLTELMPGTVFAIEDPTYHKPARIFASRGTAFRPLPLDGEGICMDAVRDSGAAAVLVTPSHHFPLGTVMSIRRRTALLDWAGRKSGRYVIEDDYDSEFRFDLRPVPALQSLDTGGRVIYMNTFTQTLAPSLRIAFMVLPEPLLERFRRRLGFYACTVSGFEQETLRRFLGGGFYERHLNRIRTACRRRRDALTEGLSACGGVLRIRGGEAGLHLLLTRKGLTEREMLAKAEAAGVGVIGLSAYFFGRRKDRRTVFAGFAGNDSASLREAGSLLAAAWK